jgi:hypothetical protein
VLQLERTLFLSQQPLLLSLRVKPVYCARPTWAAKKMTSLDLHQIIQPRTVSRISFESNAIQNCQSVAISGDDQSTTSDLIDHVLATF